MAERAPRRFRIFRALLGLSVVLVVLVGAASQLPAVRTRVHDELQAAILRELGLRAEIGPVHGAFPLRLSASFVSLTHPVHGPLVSADELEIEPAFWPLLRGKLQIERILIEGAHVRLKVQDGKVLNLPTFAPGPVPTKRKASVPRRLPLRELVVRRARFTVEADPKLRGSLEGVNAVVRIIDGTRV